MILEINGIIYDITNWDEFSKDVLEKLGFLIEGEIVKQINREKLVDQGFFKRSIKTEVTGNELFIYSTAPYAGVLEYGSAGTKKGVLDPFAESSRGPNKNRKMPLVKRGNKFELVESLKGWGVRHGFNDETSQFLLARKIQEEGMTPRAPFRKVIYNPQKMAYLINKL